MLDSQITHVLSDPKQWNFIKIIELYTSKSIYYMLFQHDMWPYIKIYILAMGPKGNQWQNINHQLSNPTQYPITKNHNHELWERERRKDISYRPLGKNHMLRGHYLRMMWDFKSNFPQCLNYFILIQCANVFLYHKLKHSWKCFKQQNHLPLWSSSVMEKQFVTFVTIVISLNFFKHFLIILSYIFKINLVGLQYWFINHISY